ncbi:MAG: alkene reductase [Polyangiales bacterium]
MPTADLLFSPFKLGRIELKNRVVMSPMTRNRSTGNVPAPIVAEYYAQRAEAGLIVTEGTSPSPNGLGYARIPGLFNAEQVAGWKRVTDAVHAKGGRIFVQLMHTGRSSVQSNMPAGAKVLAPSAIAFAGEIWADPDGLKPAATPHAMTEAEIESTIEEYVQSSHLAIEAGFDGVELHGANGYLIDQFLNTASNARTDRWGGSVENRIRFAVEVSHRVANKIGGDRLGIRLSPYGAFNAMVSDAATEEVFEALAKALKPIGLAYVHVVDHSAMGAPAVPPSVKQKIRAGFGGTIILSGGYDRTRAEHDLREHLGELVAFGRPFLANPNLVTKLKSGAALNAPDFSTFYTPGEKGYTDYPIA